MRPGGRPLLVVLSPIFLLGGAGCGPPALADLEVVNTPNAYSLSVSLAGASGWQEDAWSVSGERVWVDWEGTVLSEGRVSLELTSPDGLRAYRESAGVTGPPPAAASRVSTAGPWTLKFFWSDATGALRVSVMGVQ